MCVSLEVIFEKYIFQKWNIDLFKKFVSKFKSNIRIMYFHKIRVLLNDYYISSSIFL